MIYRQVFYKREILVCEGDDVPRLECGRAISGQKSCQEISCSRSVGIKEMCFV